MERHNPMKLELHLSADEADALKAAIARAIRREQAIIDAGPDEDHGLEEAVHERGLLANVRDVLDDQIDAYTHKYGVDLNPPPDRETVAPFDIYRSQIIGLGTMTGPPVSFTDQTADVQERERMTPAELRAMLRQIKLPQSHLAEVLGVQIRTVSRWTAGEVPIPAPVEKLINLMWRQVLTPDQVKNAKGLAR